LIVSFEDRATEDVFHGRDTRRIRRFPSDIIPVALRKLDMLNAARLLTDLRVPPGNRLHRLRGEFDGFHAIRVNDQWRIIFIWRDGDVSNVSLTDYH
jgi:proteic killer suppression protein